MNLSYKEKTLWVSLVTTIIVFGYYFFRAFNIFTNPEIENESLIGLFIGVVILLSIIQVTLIIIIAIVDSKEAEKSADEREKLIEAKAAKISYFILSTGVWTTAIGLLITSSAFILINVLILFFIVSELVGFSMQLFYYRRGI